jgi:periplasmic divalent cation tolerance protein
MPTNHDQSLALDPTRPSIVLTTWPADRDPESLATSLVEERLAACVNVLPVMESVYRWEGGVQRDRERQLIVKTTAARVDALQRRLQELHPYDVPELLVLGAVGGGTAYLEWLRTSTE